MEDLSVVNLPIERVIPYENNPRKNDEAIAVVADSIKEFGFRTPVLVNGSNVIIAGHTRLEAAKLLGMASVPCIVLTHLSEAQEKALRLVDNKTGEAASWDIAKLKEELDAIDLELPDIHISDYFELGDTSDDAGIDDEYFDDGDSSASDDEEEEEVVCQCPHCKKHFAL